MSRILSEIVLGTKNYYAAVKESLPRNESDEIHKFKYSPILNPTTTNNDSQQLKVLTQNAGLLPGIHSHCEERCEAIAMLIISNKYDIVVLQEVFHAKEISYLKSVGLENGLPYFHYFESGNGFPLLKNLEGTGMVTMSRFPIIETLYKKFVINGKPYKFFHGDYYAHKGVGLARILTPVGMVDVYNTHLHASYVDSVKYKGMEVVDEYLSTRVSQAFELAQFVRSTAHNHLAILAGDLNSTPDSTCIKCVKTVTGFFDCHKDDLLTFGTLDNTYGANKYIEQKLDYIYYKTSDSAMGGWSFKSSDIVKSKILINEEDVSISDHHGLTSIFEFVPTNSRSNTPVISLGEPAFISNSPSQRNVPGGSPLLRKFAGGNHNSIALSPSHIVTSNYISVNMNTNTKTSLSDIAVLDDVLVCLSKGYTDASVRYKSHKTRMVFIFFLMMVFAFADCFVTLTTFDSSIAAKLMVLFSGFVVAIEFVLSQYYVKGEMKYHLSIASEVERMKFGLEYFIHSLNDSLSREK